MKARDYRRLARMTLASHKKTTTQTTIGIAFGLTLLFPLVFIALGFYVGFNIEINRNIAIRSMNVSYMSEKTNEQIVNECYEEYENDIDSLNGIENSIKFQYFTFASTSSTIYQIGEDAPQRMEANNATSIMGVTVIDKEDASDPFLDNDYKINRMALMAGNTFSSDDSKGEIMVSYNFVKDTGYHTYELVGKKITLTNIPLFFGTNYMPSISDSEIIQNDLLFNNDITYFKEFTIVGVYSQRIYDKGTAREKTLANYGNNDRFNNFTEKPYFWITSDSIEEDGSSFPQMIEKTEYSMVSDESQTLNWYYYEDTPSKTAKTVTNDGCFYAPLGLGMYSPHQNKNAHFTKDQIIEFNSFGSARSGYERISEFYISSSTEAKATASADMTATGFTAYLSFYDIFLYICLALGALGGVIFIATLLNLINTLHFSIVSMKGFLGICRAEGLVSKGVIRLFLDQIMWIFFFAYLFTTVIGGGICIGIKALFDNTVKAAFKDITGLAFTIEWWYIPIALGVLIVITTALSFIISQLLAGKTSKTPILDILSEENK